MKVFVMIRIAKHQRKGVLVTTSEEEIPTKDIFHLSNETGDFASTFRSLISSARPAKRLHDLVQDEFLSISPDEIPGWDILDPENWKCRPVPKEYESHFTAPIFDLQTKIKGVGVTYKGSRDFREASKQSGNSGAQTKWGQPFKLADNSSIAFTVVRPYDYVYEAPAPEIFEKAVGIEAHKIVGPGQAIGLRSDSDLMVNEGEIGFLIDPRGRIVGHFMGNDVTDSHRESENMLYLPEAKSFDRCVAIGPWIELLDEPIELMDERSPIPIESRLTLVTYDSNNGSEHERGSYQLLEMQRKPQELAYWAMRNHTYPAGLMLLCGTGHAKGKSLLEHHVVHIHRQGLGTLINPTLRLEDLLQRPRSVQQRTFKLPC